MASALTGWDIDILTISEESERRNEDFKRLSQVFISSLDVDEVIAHLLVTEGFSNVQEISMVTVEELSSIEGFDDNLAKELKERASNHLKKIYEENLVKLKSLDVDEYLIKNTLLTQDQVIHLANKDIKTRDNLADLSSEELIESLKDIDFDSKEADKVIMEAREHWFEKKND